MSRKRLLFIPLHDLGSLPSNFMNFLFLISLVLPTNYRKKIQEQNKTNWLSPKLKTGCRRGSAFAETIERILALRFWYTCDSVLKSSCLLPSVGSRYLSCRHIFRKKWFFGVSVDLTLQNCKENSGLRDCSFLASKKIYKT